MSQDISFGVGNTPSSISSAQETTTTKAESTEQDTLTKAELLESLFVSISLPWIPILTPPDDANNTDSKKVSPSDMKKALELDLQQKQASIVTNMWQSFIDSVNQMAKNDTENQQKRSVEKASHPEKGTLRYDQMDLNRLDISAFGTAFKQWLIEPSQSVDSSVRSAAVTGPSSTVAAAANATSSQSLPTSQVAMVPQASASDHTTDVASSPIGVAPDSILNAQFVASTLVINSDFSRSATAQLNAPIDKQESLTPFSEAMAPTIAGGLHPDAQLATDKAAELIASLLYSGVKYKSTIETVMKGGGHEGIDEKQFALNIAQNVLMIVSHNVGKDEGLDQRGDLANKMIRLQLLTIALYALYKAVYQGGTSKELEGLIEGPEDLGEEVSDTPEGQMIQKILVQIKRIVPHIDAAQLKILLSYVDTKPSVKNMRDSYVVLSKNLKEPAQANRVIPIKQ